MGNRNFNRTTDYINKPKPQKINSRVQYGFLIEGEYCIIPDIAARLNVSKYVATNRVKRESGKPGPITWNGLQSKT